MDDKEVSILSIDGWRNNSSWDWNSWHKVGTFNLADMNAGTRKILTILRKKGLLSETTSKGRVAIEDDQYNLVIVDKGTREPLFAIAYGENL